MNIFEFFIIILFYIGLIIIGLFITSLIISIIIIGFIIWMPYAIIISLYKLIKICFK